MKSLRIFFWTAVALCNVGTLPVLAASASYGLPVSADAVRVVRTLNDGWKFRYGDVEGAQQVAFNDNGWETVTVPHDWAIYGPFGSGNDAQTVAIVQNGERAASPKTGRTGGLPYTGTGWYRLRFDVPEFGPGKLVCLLFDGAMSQANVYVNGHKACYWPYGYNAFHCDITGFLNSDGRDNVLAVRLENQPESSRWYPGAGLYRNIHLIVTGRTHIPVWGTHVTTSVNDNTATVSIDIDCENPIDGMAFRTSIYNQKGKKVSTASSTSNSMQIEVSKPRLWSPESPNLYKAVTELVLDGKVLDRYETSFGIRTVRLDETGFYLNGQRRKFQGVCNHHDLGPLGAAVNRSAIRHQLEMLKEMGCDAIRTSHNMPAPELVELCDEMGLMMMVEPFDEWDVQKCRNGYHRFFNEWAEKDMENMLRHFRNNPSVVMWSIGNEVPTQSSPNGTKVARFLQEICHRLDPTRPVTCGMDRVAETLRNGFAQVLDVPGLNYRVPLYVEAHETLPQKIVLGSETASTVSSRGIYKFPVQERQGAMYRDQQCSSYDVETCWWSNIPDLDFSMMEDYDWTIGQFVWTGFDYLGEPTPYDNNWPNHSSMFGIIDLASIPKDRYWLYRSVWRPQEKTIHILPHWNWDGQGGQENRLGQVTPVFVYTNYPTAELFVNGKSYGIQTRNDSTLLNRYRLMWTDVVYEPGQVKVVVYNGKGRKAGTQVMQTAGAPHHLELTPSTKVLNADGQDLTYINVKVVDKDGNLCPNENGPVSFTADGAAHFRAAANGDPTCLDAFHEPQMHLFSGQLTAIVQSGKDPGKAVFTATAPGLPSASITIKVKNAE